MKLLVFASALFISSSAFGAIALEHFAALPKFSAPMISPDGKRIASTITYQGKALLVVQKLEASSDNSNEPMSPINAGKSFINWYQWGNDDRLIFSVRGSFKMFGGLWNFGQMGSIGRNGKDALQFKMTPNVHQTSVAV